MLYWKKCWEKRSPWVLAPPNWNATIKHKYKAEFIFKSFFDYSFWRKLNLKILDRCSVKSQLNEIGNLETNILNLLDCYWSFSEFLDHLHKPIGWTKLASSFYFSGTFWDFANLSLYQSISSFNSRKYFDFIYYVESFLKFTKTLANNYSFQGRKDFERLPKISTIKRREVTNFYKVVVSFNDIGYHIIT